MAAGARPLLQQGSGFHPPISPILSVIFSKRQGQVTGFSEFLFIASDLSLPFAKNNCDKILVLTIMM